MRLAKNSGKSFRRKCMVARSKIPSGLKVGIESELGWMK